MKISINDQEVLEIKDAAEKANISIRWLYKLMDEGVIKSVSHEKRRFVVKESLEQYLKEKEKK